MTACQPLVHEPLESQCGSLPRLVTLAPRHFIPTYGFVVGLRLFLATTTIAPSNILCRMHFHLGGLYYVGRVTNREHNMVLRRTVASSPGPMSISTHGRQIKTVLPTSMPTDELGPCLSGLWEEKEKRMFPSSCSDPSSRIKHRARHDDESGTVVKLDAALRLSDTMRVMRTRS